MFANPFEEDFGKFASEKSVYYRNPDSFLKDLDGVKRSLNWFNPDVEGVTILIDDCMSVIRDLVSQVEKLETQVVWELNENQKPEFTHGPCVCELAEPVTAARCEQLVDIIELLQKSVVNTPKELRDVRWGDTFALKGVSAPALDMSDPANWPHNQDSVLTKAPGG